MDGILSTKMKRKDMDEVYDEFSEFSLYSPARKIRRLDAELPPIMEEEDPAIPLSFKQQMSESGSAMIDSELPLPLNEDRALVLYKPVDIPCITSPGSNLSFRVDPQLVNGLKNQAFCHRFPNPVKIEEIPMDVTQADNSSSLAVIPWVASQSESINMFVEEPMEAEEISEHTSMEIEEDRNQVNISNSNVLVGEGMHAWQQHCLIPPLPQNSSTPVTWSWQ